jgi:acetylornithine deacetylase/succinyl-diaminopimelate desuccinylase-like protein
MKGSVACALAAAEQFSESDLKCPIYITCTADEEIGCGGAGSYTVPLHCRTRTAQRARN